MNRRLWPVPPETDFLRGFVIALLLSGMSQPDRHTVAVIMERTQITRGLWSVPSWRAVSILAGERVAGKRGRSAIYERDEEAQYLWSGLSLAFYRDLAEEYWYNLTGDNPSLFVVCHESPDGELTPFEVTANHDVATTCLESDDQVFAVPIPPEIYAHLEKFVVDHFVPKERKKRKRKNWSEKLN
jgi:hypothetical protein